MRKALGAATAAVAVTLACTSGSAAADPGGGSKRYCSPLEAVGQLDFRACVESGPSWLKVWHTLEIHNTENTVVWYDYEVRRGVDKKTPTTCKIAERLKLLPGEWKTWDCWSTADAYYAHTYMTRGWAKHSSGSASVTANSPKLTR